MVVRDVARVLDLPYAEGDRIAKMIPDELNTTLETALEFINPDELVEVTPKSVRLRKRILDHNDRKKAEKRDKPKA